MISKRFIGNATFCSFFLAVESARGADNDESFNELWMTKREVEGDAASERIADDDAPLDARSNERGCLFQIGADLARTTMARQVNRYHRVGRGEFVGKGPPAAGGLGEAVQQRDRRGVSGAAGPSAGEMGRSHPLSVEAGWRGP